MPRYRVNLRTVASISVEVEADNEDAALEAGYDQAPYEVCAQCSGWEQPWSLELGELEASDINWPPVKGYPAVELISSDEEKDN